MRRTVLLAAVLVPGCALSEPDVVRLRAEPQEASARHLEPRIERPAPGANPWRERGPRCIRLEDDSGWTCSPAATSVAELAELVAVADVARVFPEGHVPWAIRDASGAAGLGFFALDTQFDFGGVSSFVALQSAGGGWGYAADAGRTENGVNGDSDVRLDHTRTDERTGLAVVETIWEGSDAACTEPLSWTLHERRSTICDPARLQCRTLPTERTVIERRDLDDERFRERRLPESFRARIVLREDGRIALRPARGRLPREARRAARATALDALPIGIDPWER
jgi:hypothetical protein